MAVAKAKHVAIIMDGNGRWATKKGFPRKVGHQRGVKNTERIIKAAVKQSIDYLSLFAFSTENWKRPRREVKSLFNLLENYLANDIKKLHEIGVRLVVSGDYHSFNEKTVEKLEEAMRKTKRNKGITVNLMLNYSGRWDILQAVKKIISNGVRADISLAKLEKEFSRELSQPGIPDPDLIIRTGNEMRISNFYLWQAAYSEIHTVKKMWPDFTPRDLEKALDVYYRRDRRYGGLSQKRS
jgi:undecaprenyl diphosphate synthase